MPSPLTIITTLLIVYLTSYIYRLIRNYLLARKSGFPYFIVPWEQDHIIWMIISVPLRPWLKKNLPTFIYNRLVLTIYGFEFTEKLRMFQEYGGQDVQSYVMVTVGKYEFSTRDPELATEILRRTRDFQQQDAIGVVLDRFGKNLLSSDGEDWVRQRRVVASTLNERISKTIFEESVKQTEGLLGDVGGGEVTGKLFDGMKKITINVLTGAGMGESVAWREDEDEGVKGKGGYRMSYIECVKVVIECVAGPIVLPKWFLEWYPSFAPGSDLLRRLNVAVEEFPRHTWELLDKEKQRMQHGSGESRSNIISQLLKASEDFEGEKKGGKALSDDEMLGNLFIFMGAGFDTTANTLSFALVLLARHPEWQDWLFTEIDDILPPPGSELSYTALLPKVTRILALMFETLRLYTPLIHLAKQTRAEQTITTSSGKTFWFPKNATVYVNTVAIHMDEKVYRNINLKPGEESKDNDELLFRPTRWLNADNTTLWTAPKGSFIPWSAGPRVCPGQKMAQVEFVSIFLRLFGEFRLEAVPLKGETRREVEERLDARMQESFSILTLQMKDLYNVDEEEKGVRVRLVRRK
ncbi:hypothetical protein M409DRAFT_19058 [Zasmidium cellare ATCC 36951]|uniref:Cytochrome P450 monooxygenase n=1 Tax=Zasmidium cellare ATCC 36951 TaxID=1080233 RepID=A0A6A6CV82_ZASCE|nr:uncharacterized protein M409DRAFT_19058 [Zasmidium cellare ATCC 36951]KAF2171087.1 hypothetical protein M409DRAFT_19058 [Zasmidium cellare ATCC 36951]